MQFSQRLLDALGDQGRQNVTAIESKLNQMLSMIEEYHECFDGIWFSGFVRMGQGGPLEMITTREIRVVSNGGRDVNCSTQPLTFNSRRCLLQASMEALVHVVDHPNKRFEADRSGWRNVISSAHNLLTRHDLGRFRALCNNGYDAVEGEYYLYENWQSSFLGCPTYIWIRNGVEGHEEVEGSNYLSRSKTKSNRNYCCYSTINFCLFNYFQLQYYLYMFYSNIMILQYDLFLLQKIIVLLLTLFFLININIFLVTIKFDFH